MNIVTMASFTQKDILMNKLDPAPPTPRRSRKEKELSNINNSNINNSIIHNGSSHAEKIQNNVSREVI